jgi:hypothetical protein
MHGKNIYLENFISNLKHHNIHYEKSCPLKPHYPIIKTKKNSYTNVMQLSFGYYNYYAAIPLKIRCINK